MSVEYGSMIVRLVDVQLFSPIKWQLSRIHIVLPFHLFNASRISQTQIQRLTIFGVICLVQINEELSTIINDTTGKYSFEVVEV
ncbi:hypothetical protein P5673_016074 [Acropora cervicornis]|uniref:Uncharacterized protein n=1 Tax=Acropora cervicornis TaxID=6130 RepID=A0AAD9QGP7_ACRCE|nr:hypothetical protein P5673_016074 [Acropora cervicornis]